MKWLIKNEIHFCFSRKNIITFLIAALTLCLSFVFIYEKEYLAYSEVIKAELDKSSQYAESSILQIKNVLAVMRSDGASEAEMEPYNQVMAIWKTEKEHVDFENVLWKNMKEDSAEMINEERLLRDENAKKIADTEDPMMLDTSSIYRDTIRDWNNRMKLHEVYAQKGIAEPINPKTPTGAYLLSEGLNGFSPLVLVLLISLLIWNADIWADEFEDNAYQLLFTLPFKRMSIYLARVVTRICFSFIASGLLIGLFYMLGYMKYGAGFDTYVISNQLAMSSWKMLPGAEIMMENDIIVNIGKLILCKGILMTAYLFLFAGIINLVSFLGKSKGIALMVPAIMILIFYMMVQMSLDPAEFMYNPFGYLLTSAIIDGRMGISYPLSLLILSGSGMLTYLFTAFVLAKKDLTGR